MTEAVDINLIPQWGWQEHSAAPAAGPMTAFDTVVFAAGVLSLLIFSLAWAAPLSHYNYAESDSGVLRAVNFPAYAACLLIVGSAWRRAARAVVQNWILAALLGLVLASVTWSLDPPSSLRRWVALSFLTATGIGLAARFSWVRLVEVVAVSFGIVAVTSFFMGAAVPQLGRMHELFPGAWRGDYLEKNGLGSMMSVGTIVMIAAAIYVPPRRLLWLGLAGLCLVVLLLSTSKTALLSAILGGAIMGLVWMVRRGPLSAVAGIWLAGAAVLALASLFAFAPDLAFKAVGKDATLTGRTQVWSAAIHQLSEHRWLGFGYAVVWEHPEHWYPAAKIFKEAKFSVQHAHNGWLETAMSIGLVGLGVWTLYFLQVLGRAAVCLFRGGGAYLALPFIAMFTQRSITEVSIIDYQDILWVLFVAFAVKLGLDKGRGGTNAV